MSKILFINHPSFGHLNTLLSLALQMKSAGHEVRFILPYHKAAIPIPMAKTAAAVANRITSCEIPLDTIRPPLSQLRYVWQLPATKGYQEMQTALRLFFSGLDYLTQKVLQNLQTNRPDVVVNDFSFMAAFIAADKLKIPCVPIYHSGLPFQGEEIPPFGSGLPIGKNYEELGPRFVRAEQKILRQLDAKINKVRAKYELMPMAPRILRYPYSQWFNLIVSHEGIEAPRNNLGDRTFFIGPCFANRQNPTRTDFPFDKIRSDKYKIFVSLGTVFNNKPQVFEKIITAFSKPEFQLIIAAGGAYATLKKKAFSDQIMLLESAPQLELLPLIDMVIGHGGNNTTNETLAAGKPLLILPVGGEQRDNASRIVYLQAGLQADIDRCTPEEILSKVVQIKSNPLFAAKAQYYKSLLDKTNGPVVGAQMIGWLARSQKPLIKPDSLSRNITPENIAQLLNQ